MKSYIEREKFDKDMMSIWCSTSIYVANVADTWGNELRCHELARAVRSVLILRGDHTTHIVDGRLFGIEHSWLVLPSKTGQYCEGPILDAYCPGRTPQVQLIDNHWAVARGYEPGKDRKDINTQIVARLIEEMLRAA